jgi:hypothetical protein
MDPTSMERPSCLQCGERAVWCLRDTWGEDRKHINRASTVRLRRWRLEEGAAAGIAFGLLHPLVQTRYLDTTSRGGLPWKRNKMAMLKIPETTKILDLSLKLLDPVETGHRLVFFFPPEPVLIKNRLLRDSLRRTSTLAICKNMGNIGTLPPPYPLPWPKSKITPSIFPSFSPGT